MNGPHSISPAYINWAAEMYELANLRTERALGTGCHLRTELGWVSELTKSSSRTSPGFFLWMRPQFWRFWHPRSWNQIVTLSSMVKPQNNNSLVRFGRSPITYPEDWTSATQQFHDLYTPWHWQWAELFDSELNQELNSGTGELELLSSE